VKTFPVILLLALAVALAASAGDVAAQAATPETPQAADDPAGDAAAGFPTNYRYRWWLRGKFSPSDPDEPGTRGGADQGYRYPPAWLHIYITSLKDAGGGRQAGQGLRGAAAPSGEPARLTSEDLEQALASGEAPPARAGLAAEAWDVPDAGNAGADTPDSDAVARISLGARLAAAGRETGSPWALAAAAELMASAGVADSERAKAGVEGDPAPEGAVPTEGPVTDPAALFSEAAALAKAASNEALAAQIDERAAAAGSRSPAGRSVRHRDRVDPYATDVYSVRYRGGETARATAAADGRYDIDLYVYDDSGNLITYDNDLTSIGICTWRPARTGDYYLGVKNATEDWVTYLLYTN
jgi:hypothetical protein